jgi:CheY-like chemotaxis protein
LFSILQSAEDASLKTKDLSLQLLSFTKCGEPVKEVTSARDLIVKSAKFALSGSRLDYILNLQDDLWNVKVDRSQINQVIYNIVLNAIQAQGKSGNISISAMNVSHNSDPDISGTENFVKIIIRDSGPGIPADVINSIFDPFFTTKREGSGLGLSIVYSIIKKHEGFINVTSIEGEGAIFEIFIPATDESLIDADVKTGHVLHRRGRVLIVDDDKKIIHVLSRMLTILGFAVDSVSDGESAVKFYRIAVSAGSAYDVVIMDLTMRGGIGGDEAARILKEYDPGAKIIVSSGYANDSIMANYRDYGFVDSLQKPYGMEDLKSVIGRVFQ